jgi:hypothetical protein
MEFLNAIGPALGVLLLALAGWLQLHTKIKEKEQVAVTTNQKVETNKEDIQALQVEYERVKKESAKKIHELEMTNAGLNADLAELILELRGLTDTIKDASTAKEPTE